MIWLFFQCLIKRLICFTCFDALGVSGVYKVMKAERLSRKKSLTVAVAPSLTDFKSKGR
jgi:hypothetical protein